MTSLSKIGPLLLLLATASTVRAAPPEDHGASCFGTSTILTFGDYDVFNTAPVDGTASFTVTCSRQGGPKNISVEVTLGSSLHSGAINIRQMGQNGGSSRLNYNLYRDAAKSSVWGETFGSNTVQQTVSIPNKSSATTTFTIFGRIFPGQDASIGSYSDNLLVTLYY